MVDLHLHILEGITEETVKQFCDDDKWTDEVILAVSSTPSIWVGRFRAGLDQMHPQIRIIHDLVESYPVLSNNLITKILAQIDPERSPLPMVAKRDMRRFLRLHQGKKIFAVAW